MRRVDAPSVHMRIGIAQLIGVFSPTSLTVITRNPQKGITSTGWIVGERRPIGAAIVTPVSNSSRLPQDEEFRS
jgi:hypothetical protein